MRPDPCGWRGRPLPVYLILLYSIVQLLGEWSQTLGLWDMLIVVVEQGRLSLFDLLGVFVFSLFHVMAALLLLLMRKSAAYAFSAYLLWVLLKYFGANRIASSHLDLLLSIAIAAYCWFLYRRGRLA